MRIPPRLFISAHFPILEVGAMAPPMARRASSSVNPIWLIVAAAVLAAAVAAVLIFKDTVSDPYRTLPQFPVTDYMQNSNSLRGNVYKMECVIGEQLGYDKGGRVFAVEVNNEPVSLLVPGELREVNIQKGQRFLFKVEVGNGGILRALEGRKA
jgi:hypothetical protein